LNRVTASRQSEIVTYKITIKARFGQEWTSRLVNLSVRSPGEEDARYRSVVVDLRNEAALMQLLNEIHGHGIELVSLHRIHPPAHDEASSAIYAH
jgi:hypothetical protein